MGGSIASSLWKRRAYPAEISAEQNFGEGQRSRMTLSSQMLCPKLWSSCVAFHFQSVKLAENGLVLTQDLPLTAFAIGEPCNEGKRFEAAVRSRSRSKSVGSSISLVVRQHQFPSEEPGVFIRASAPRLSTSCRGAMASAATEDHACWSNSLVMDLASPSPRCRQPRTFLRSSSGKASYHPRVVLLSWVPVYTTELGV